MHKIKSEAKRTAWDDKSNPFARWKPARTNTQARMEEGRSTRTRTAPEPSAPLTTDGDLKQRQYATDPNSRSRNLEGQEEFTNSLEHVTSPDQYDVISTNAKANANRTESDRTSTTEVATNNATTSSSYHKDGEDEKKHHRIHMPGFLGGKKEKEEDYNNGKDKSSQPHFTFWGQFRSVIFGSWINVLLIFSPIGIALHFAKANEVAIFVVNFIAIIPLAGTLSYATEEIALRTGEVLGGLLNASFG